MRTSATDSTLFAFRFYEIKSKLIQLTPFPIGCQCNVRVCFYFLSRRAGERLVSYHCARYNLMKENAAKQNEEN